MAFRSTYFRKNQKYRKNHDLHQENQENLPHSLEEKSMDKSVEKSIEAPKFCGLSFSQREPSIQGHLGRAWHIDSKDTLDMKWAWANKNCSSNIGLDPKIKLKLIDEKDAIKYSKIIYEGYFSKENPPIPYRKPIPEMQDLIKKLQHMEANCEENSITIIYLTEPQYCELCPPYLCIYGEQCNSSSTSSTSSTLTTTTNYHCLGGIRYECELENGAILIWPGSYMHYLVNHNVPCSEIFSIYLRNSKMRGTNPSEWEKNYNQKPRVGSF